MNYWLLRTTSPTSLRESVLLQASWPVFAAVEHLKAEHAADLAAALDRMLGRWGSDPQRAWYIARAAVDLGSAGGPVVLRALRRHPAVPGIRHLAAWAAESADQADEFVYAVADQVLNTSPQTGHPRYPPSLLRSLAEGINRHNYADRIRLLCYKLRSIPQHNYDRQRLVWQRAGSLDGFPDVDRSEPFSALLAALVASLRHAVAFADVAELLTTVSPLPDDIRERVRIWILGNAPTAEPGDLIDAITNALASRSPTGDDLRLVDRVVAECDADAYTTAWATASGPPPPVSELGTALATHEVPPEWQRAFQWSGLLPEHVTDAWTTAVAIMSSAYGDPSRATLEQPPTMRVGVGHSPLSEDDLQAMPIQDAARWIASWRPDPSDWLVSARELGRTLQATVKSDTARWASSPLQTAVMLRHPTYINHYLQGLTTAASLDGVPIPEIVDLMMLIRTHPWPAATLGNDTFDFDSDWRGAEQASIDLIKSIANSDAGFGDRRAETWSILRDEVGRSDRPSSTDIGTSDPMAAINRPSTLALEAALSFTGHEYRTDGSIRPEALTLLSQTLQLTGRDGAEHRAILAPRIGFLRHIAPEWVDEHREELFGQAAPDELGQLTVDLALTWGRPNAWLLENYPDAVRSAVARNVDNALAHYVIAMLWQLPRYSSHEAARYLQSTHMLSAAGEKLGLLLRSEDARPEHADRAAQFWQQVLEGGNTETLAGFGWLADARSFDDDRWADLTLRTLTASHGQIDWSHKVAERAAAQPASTRTLAILNELVRGLADDWDRRSVAELATRVLTQADHLTATPEYTRLQTTLLERGML